MKQLGSRASGFNGSETKRNEEFQAKHGDRLEVLHNQYPYKVVFIPTPKETAGSSPRKKRARESMDEENGQSSKMMKTETTAKPSVESSSDISQLNNGGQTEPPQAASSAAVPALVVNEREENEFGVWEHVDKDALLIYTHKNVQSRNKVQINN